jgi:hypothetical protein
MKNSKLNISHLSVCFQVETAIRNFQAYFEVLKYEDFATHVHSKFKLSVSAWDELLKRYENK